MKEVKNPITGEPEYQFSGKLIRANAEELVNKVTGSKYRLAEVEFTNAKGIVQRATCSIYSKNWNYGMKVGESYLCTAQLGADNKVYIHMSHLTQVSAATVDDFGFIASESPSTTTSRIEVGAGVQA